MVGAVHRVVPMGGSGGGGRRFAADDAAAAAAAAGGGDTAAPSLRFVDVVSVQPIVPTLKGGWQSAGSELHVQKQHLQRVHHSGDGFTAETHFQ